MGLFKAHIFGAAVVSVFLVVTGCTYKIADKDAQLIDEINNQGVGTRLVLPEIKPNPDGITATYEISGQLMMAPYGGEVKMGDGSVLRISRDVFFQNVTFHGDQTEPLVFMMSKDYGLVYLYGRGQVKRTNGETIKLP